LLLSLPLSLSASLSCSLHLFLIPLSLSPLSFSSWLCVCVCVYLCVSRCVCGSWGWSGGRRCVFSWIQLMQVSIHLFPISPLPLVPITLGLLFMCKKHTTLLDKIKTRTRDH